MREHQPREIGIVIAGRFDRVHGEMHPVHTAYQLMPVIWTSCRAADAV
jgi:hypothetical protein